MQLIIVSPFIFSVITNYNHFSARSIFVASEIDLALAMKARALAQIKRRLILPLMEFSMVALVELPCAASCAKKIGLLFFPMHQMSPPLVEHTSNPVWSRSANYYR